MANKRIFVSAGLLLACATNAWASAVDSELRDFALSAMTEDKATREQDRVDLNKKIIELGKRVPRADYADLEKQVAKYQAEKLLLERIASEVPAKFDDKTIDGVKFTTADVAALDKPASGRDVNAINSQRATLANDQTETDTALRTLKAKKVLTGDDIAKKAKLESHQTELKSQDVKLKAELAARGAVTKTVPMGKEQRILLVATMQKNSDGKVEMSFTAKWNPAKKDALPSEVKERFSDKELNDYIQTQVGDHFGDKITLDSPVNDAAIQKALKSAKDSSFIKNMSEDVSSLIAERKQKVGTDRDQDSLVGQATAKLNEKKGLGNNDKKAELQAKVSLIAWLKTHSSANMEVCQVYKEALGDWTKFPAAAKEECPKLDPAVAEADKAKEAELAKLNTDQQNNAQLALQQQWAAATAQCNRKAAEDAVQAMTAETTKSLASFKNYVEQKVLPKSKLFLLLLSKADDADNPVNNGVASPISPDDVMSVVGTVGKGIEGSKELISEKSALDDMMTKAFQNLKASESVQGAALAQMEAAMAAGKPLPLDPTALQSSNQGVVQMREWYNKIVALRAGVVAELNTRSAQNDNRFGSSAPANNGAPAQTGVSARPLSNSNSNGGSRRAPTKGTGSSKPRYLQ